MRDDLTVLVQRIHPRADDFEIFEFFSQAGKVRDIRLIRDQRSNKSKGVGYVEFFDPQSVMNALALNGIAFKGQPLMVQASMAEKNRLAQQAKNVAAASAMMGGGAPPSEPSKLIVSELHPNFSEGDVREVFSPFGEIASIELPTVPETGANTGLAHIVFVNPEEAKAAEQAMNGIELAGKRLQCVVVSEQPAAPPPAAAIPNALPNMLPNMMGMMPGMMAPGMMPGMMGMMPGMMPPTAMMAAGMPGVPLPPGAGAPSGGASSQPAAPLSGPPTAYVLMKNFFDPNGDDERHDPDFFLDLKDDVTEECAKHGDVLETTILRDTQGHILFRFADEQGAAKAAGALNGRWFAGKQIAADTITEAEYEEMRLSAADGK